MGFRIFADIAVPSTTLKFLREITEGHQLLLPSKPVASVLHKADPDPLLYAADIAFGQPDPDALVNARQLQWVHVSSSSITRYDNPAIRKLMAERNVVVTNSASVYAEACAEHALAFMLAQSRQLPVALRTRVPGGDPNWQALRSSLVPLRGQTVLIVGYGAIGKRLVELLGPFGMKIIAFRRNARGDEEVPIINQAQLELTMARGFNHIVNILPDSTSTYHFFDAARFHKMRPGAVFYNIGRGSTVNQDALYDALRSGGLKAAWLDVTDPEPLPDEHPLYTLPNCFVTPHVAGGHLGESETLLRHFQENLNRFVRVQPLLDRVM
jgi:phosphoglycerate dehydrogenase-like enzyme